MLVKIASTVALCLALLVLEVQCSPAEDRSLVTQPCGTYTMEEGQRIAIQSPNFPNTYSTNTRCQWELRCPSEEAHTLEINCPKFALEASTDCVNDRLIVATRGSRQTKCGNDTPDGTIAETGFARFTFYSNPKVVRQGFRCYIWCKAKPTTTTTTATTTTTTTPTPTNMPTPTSMPITTSATTTVPATAPVFFS